jgi:uncharacterized protein (DUF1499 family)
MRTLWTKSWIKLTGLAVFILFFSCAGSPPENLGVQGGLMAPVPPSPNAVSTQAPMDDKIHFIEPIPYDGNPQEFRRLVIQVLESWEGATLVKAEGPYIYATFRSKLMGYVDDTEVYFDQEKAVLHFRSASRVGYGDMGVNRSRYEEFKKKFFEKLSDQ